jgi:hypothetical protein
MSSTWQIILQQIQAFQENAQKLGYPLWYRGHRRAEWPLKTTLHRRVEENLRAVGTVVPEGEQVEMLRDVYKSLYRKYKARAWHLLSSRELSDWGIVFSMQHHGIPTRLLDWTESFACALYFAHDEREPSDDAAIFILSPEELNEVNFGSRGQVALGEDITGSANLELSSYHPGYVSFTRPLHTIAVFPVLSNPRMVAKQSTFTLVGDPFQSLDERYSQCILKIVLPADTYYDSKHFLRLVGTSHFKYFPDLQGLKRELMSQLDGELEIAQQCVADYLQPKLPLEHSNGT